MRDRDDIEADIPAIDALESVGDTRDRKERQLILEVALDNREYLEQIRDRLRQAEEDSDRLRRLGKEIKALFERLLDLD